MIVLLSTSALTFLAILALLPTGMLRVGPVSGKRDSHHGSDLSASGGGKTLAYSIWTWVKGTWVLMEKCSQAGCACAPPRDRPGLYEGEVVRRECPPPVEGEGAR